VANTTRVAVFIDGANLYNRLRQCRWPTNIDVGEFGARLAGTRSFIGAWYYNVSPPAERPADQIRKQEAYYARIREHGLTTFRLGFLQRRRVDGKVLYEEKGVDVALVVDMLTGAFEERYDTAILVSSDGDFKPAVEAVDATASTSSTCTLAARSDPRRCCRHAMSREGAAGPGWLSLSSNAEA